MWVRGASDASGAGIRWFGFEIFLGEALQGGVAEAGQLADDAAREDRGGAAVLAGHLQNFEEPEAPISSPDSFWDTR